MLSRAKDAGVAGIVALTTDCEKSTELSALVRAHSGFLYIAAGVHPDNVKKGLSDKAVDALLADVRAAALVPECVSIFCGLDYSRDFASHFAQEKLLDAHLTLAADVRLPVIIHVVGEAGETVAEKISAWLRTSDAVEDAALGGDGPARLYSKRALVLGFEGDEKSLRALVGAGAFVSVSGAICAVGPAGDSMRHLSRLIPLDRLILASMSPLHTPATIADDFVRSARNEPSNMPELLPTLFAALETTDPALSAATLSSVLFENARNFFGLHGDSSDSVDRSVVGGSLGQPVDTTGQSSTSGPLSAAVDDAASAVPRNELNDSADDVIEQGRESVRAAAGGGGGGEDEPHLDSGEAMTTVHRCRSCRTVLFDDDDIMPHTSAGLHPSVRTASKAPPLPAASSSPVRTHAGSGGGGGGSGKGAPSSAAAAAVTVEEVGVSRWREAKGKAVIVSASEGACRAHLIDRMAWMVLPAGEPEGSLVCPGCSTKVGQYSLSGLKCSCGLLVTPAFKVPKQRVDAVREGAGALEAALRAAQLAERGLGGDEDYDGPGRDGDEATGRREKKKGMSKVPVSHNKGNFSQFRNKDTTPRSLQAKKLAEETE
jgi:TatD DNase family protein